jgi:hypothetical protein
MFNIIKICKEAILRDQIFFDIFDRVIDLVADFHDIKDWAKKVDDQLKDVVYNTLSK